VGIYERLLIQTHKIAERRQKSIIPSFTNGVKADCSSSARADVFGNSAFCRFYLYKDTRGQESLDIAVP